MEQAAEHDANVGLACKGVRQGAQEKKTAVPPDWAAGNHPEKKSTGRSLLEIRHTKWNQTRDSTVTELPAREAAPPGVHMENDWHAYLMVAALLAISLAQ